MTWDDNARRRLAAAGAALLVLLAAVLARPGDPRLPAAPAAGTWQTPAGALGWQLSAVGGFAVTDGETTLWQADPAWRVTGALTGDLDADGADELALLVWRRGFYGPSRPFWREADAAGRVYTQHQQTYRGTVAQFDPCKTAALCCLCNACCSNGSCFYPCGFGFYR